MSASAKEKITSSTAKGNTPVMDTSSKPQGFSSGTSMKEISSQEMLQQLAYYLSSNNRLEEKVNKIEKNQKRQEKLFTSMTKLSNISGTAIILLLLVPIIQLFLCTAVVYGLGIEEKLPNLLTYFLGGVSLATLAEVGYSFFAIGSIRRRIEDIEKKLED